MAMLLRSIQNAVDELVRDLLQVFVASWLLKKKSKAPSQIKDKQNLLFFMDKAPVHNLPRKYVNAYTKTHLATAKPENTIGPRHLPSQRIVSCNLFRVSIPAVMAKGFPLKVPAWYMGPAGATISMMSFQAKQTQTVL